MTAGPDVTESTVPMPAVDGASPDRRGSWMPSAAMISTRFMELRKRNGLMATLVVVTVGIPTAFLAIRLLLHGIAPNTYGPAGGYIVYTRLVAGILYVFGFIVAAALGATAGSADLSEGMFRHLVVTGRSRLAIYLARIPAGLAIIVPLVTIGFGIVCAVCVFAAPTHLNVNGVSVPADLSKSELRGWAADHADEVICNFNFRAEASSSTARILGSVTCPGQRGRGPATFQPPGSQAEPPASQAAIRATAAQIADVNYPTYARQFLYPPASLMIKSWLWLALEAVIGFIVGLGLGSLTGQRTVSVILMVVLELILTPIAARARIPHFANAQRAVVGLATAHLAPAGLPVLGGGGGGPPGSTNPELLPESAVVAVSVIVAWLIGWSVLGAWRMMTREA